MTRVELTFRWEGYVGREAYEIELISDRPDVTALVLAFRDFERDLIDCGALTFECGCCVQWDTAKLLAFAVHP